MKKIIVGCIILIFIACIFPPWSIHHNGRSAYPREYSFILTPPDATYYSLDLKILIMEILVIVALTLAVLVLVKKMK